MKSNHSTSWGYKYPPKSQKELREDLEEAICQKYKLGPYYYSNHGAIRTYDDEAKSLFNSFHDKISYSLDKHIEYHQYETKKLPTYGPTGYRQKIVNTPNQYKEYDKYDEALESYKKELGKKTGEIIHAPNMNEADKLADKLHQYHDEVYPNLLHSMDSVVEDFTVKLAGIEPDVYPWAGQ
jgi:hypothetical protein